MAEKKEKVFILNSRYNIQKNKFEIKIEINDKIKNILKESLSVENDIMTSDTWKDENGKRLEFYRGQLIIDNITNYLNVKDAFGATSIKNNIAILRAKKLLDENKVILAVDFCLSEDIKYMFKAIKDVLSMIMRSMDFEYTAIGYIEEKEKCKSITNEEVQ